MYLVDFLVMLGFILIFGVILACGILFTYFDAWRMNPIRVRIRALKAIDAEMKEVGERNDITDGERHTAQAYLLRAKMTIYNIHTRW